MAIGRHKAVERRMARLEAAQADKHANIGHHQIIWGSPDRLIAAGIAGGFGKPYQGVSVPDCMVWPLPIEEIAYAAQVGYLVVVEELDPFIETESVRQASPARQGAVCRRDEESCRSAFVILAEQADNRFRRLVLAGPGVAAGEYTTDLIRMLLAYRVRSPRSLAR